MVTHVNSRFVLGLLLRAADVSKVRPVNCTQDLHVYFCNRLCLPEEHNVRNIIYATMKSHASIIREFSSGSLPSAPHFDDHHSIPRVGVELQRLIQLFDDVLLEGYSDNHDTLPLASYVGRNPTCHYCGASLFLSYFECAGTCFDLETESPLTDRSIRVCGPCYVEGRFCACKEMTPKRLRDFDTVLHERNTSTIALLKYLASNGGPTGNLGEISER